MKQQVITIDGPAGAGKTTVSRMLAQRLGFQYIDTGALYRGVAYEARSAGISSDNDTGLDALCAKLKFDFKTVEGGLRLLSNGVDITDHIRSPEITMMASAVSARATVREFLLEVQRNLARAHPVVIEGRDMGTVVFPHADVKFFLSASAETRAKRRYDELKETAEISFVEVKNDLEKRDENDSNRKLAPLKPATDAVHIDSTHLSVEGVVEKMIAIIQKQSPAQP